MQYKTIVELLNSDPTHHEVMVRGWVRSFRSNRFIALNDGSTIKTLQCVVDFENFDEELLKKVTVGAAIEVKGALVESQGQGQTVECVCAPNLRLQYTNIFRKTVFIICTLP